MPSWKECGIIQMKKYSPHISQAQLYSQRLSPASIWIGEEDVTLLPHCVTNAGLHKGSLGSWKYFSENFPYYSEYGILNKCIGFFSPLG